MVDAHRGAGLGGEGPLLPLLIDPGIVLSVLTCILIISTAGFILTACSMDC